LKERQERYAMTNERANTKEHGMTVKAAVQKKTSSAGPQIAAVLVRGLINARDDVKETFNLLKLGKKNYCVVLNSNPSTLGMLSKVKDYITWGEITPETYALLTQKKQEIDTFTNKPKKFFKLQPPTKGYGRKGIKRPFNMGGGLGYRGKAMDDLLRRMLR